MLMMSRPEQAASLCSFRVRSTEAAYFSRLYHGLAAIRRIVNTTLGDSMHPSLAFAFSVAVIAWTTSAAADSKKLKGEYGFTGTAACLVAPGSAPGPGNPTPGVALPNSGFNANLQPIVSATSFSRSFSVEGIRKFNGDGTGTVKGTTVGISVRPTPGPTGYPSFPPSAGSSEFSFSFTYTVDGDGGWTSTMVPGSFTSTHVAGPRTGQTSTVDAIPPVSGMISQDGKTMIVAHLAPDVETHSYSNGDVWPEICHRSRVFIALKN
jgi:hypothetical protein